MTGRSFEAVYPKRYVVPVLSVTCPRASSSRLPPKHDENRTVDVGTSNDAANASDGWQVAPGAFTRGNAAPKAVPVTVATLPATLRPRAPSSSAPPNLLEN